MHASQAADGGAVTAADVVEAAIAASRALVGVAARSLAGFDEQVTLAQFRTLVLVCTLGPQRVADLAHALAVNPSTATRMCDRLVHKGLVGRDRETGDRRSVRVEVTSAGRALVDEVTERRRVEIGRIISSIPAGSWAPLVEAMRLFAGAAGEAPDQSWSSGWE